MEKRIRQNQDLAKCCKNRFFTTFLIWNWIEKTHSPKPRSCQMVQKSIFNTFLIRNWIAKTHSPKPRSCQKLQNRFLIWNWIEKTHSPKPKILPKAAKSIFHYFFNLKLNRKNAFAKTKILPNGAKIQFEIEQKNAFAKTKILPNGAKIIFFNTFSTKIYNIFSVGWETW